MFGILNCHERYAYVNGTIPQLQTAVADFLVAKTSGYFISTIVSLFETASRNTEMDTFHPFFQIPSFTHSWSASKQKNR